MLERGVCWVCWVCWVGGCVGEWVGRLGLGGEGAGLRKCLG